MGSKETLIALLFAAGLVFLVPALVKRWWDNLTREGPKKSIFR